jgi:bifunctional non-homologous end joining protein LigD
MADALKTYRSKRDFSKTAEPSGASTKRKPGGNRYLIQKHDASRLHYDFRLEHRGVLLSWAVTRGPSLDPHDKRLAVHVEDHPLDYGDFEGTIPEGEYGGGTVMLWDEGTWEPVGDVDEGLAKGDFKFILHGERLKGKWVLVRMRPRPGERSKHENWLLIKERDEYATEEKTPVIERVMKSVRTGRTMDEIAAGNLEWTRTGAREKTATAKSDDAKPGARKRETRAKSRRGSRASASDPEDDSSGPPAKLPKFVEPQLATLVDDPPPGDGWVHEIKYDGYRALAAVAGGKVRIFTRKALDWTERYGPLVRPLADLPCRSALLDGEIAVADEKGHTDFGALQAALGEGGDGIVFYAFDLLEVDGVDLKRRPLLERKAKLAELLKDQPQGGPIIYSDHVVGHGADVFAQACGMGLEGIISKRADAPYSSTRGKSWLKIKCGMGQEFIVIGWRPSDVQGRPFSSILVGVREGDRIVYRGRVGSGFGEREQEELWPELQKRTIAKPAAEGIPREILRDAKFVRPELIAEIAFRGWTHDEVVRQASYKGLRNDKKAADVVAEKPKHTEQVVDTKTKERGMGGLVTIDSDRDRGTIEIEGVRVTHPNRVLYGGTRITKKRLIEYYLDVADLLLPHVAGRPLSLVRCPEGAEHECFFQKHASRGFPNTFKAVRIKEKSGSDDYLYIEDKAGLVGAVQMGVLELHLWGSTVKALETPDRMVFDFDPDEKLDFKAVKAAATEMRDRLQALKLTSFLMTSGGKGLHVIVPLKPGSTWEHFRDFAEAMARSMAEDSPDRYLAKATKAERGGRIFIDYLRNGRGATAIAPFSSRVRKGGTVAWPLAWEELPRLKDAHPATVETAAAMLKKRKKDPWEGYFKVRQKLP